MAAQTTLDFVKELNDQPNMDFKFVSESVAADGTTTKTSSSINAPMLALVKVPALNFNSLDITFDFSISEVHKVDKASTGTIGGSIGTQGILSKFVNATFTGSLTRTVSDSDTASQSGSLHVELHVTESALPEGLQKILTALTNSIDVKPLVAPPVGNLPAPPQA